MTFFFISFFSTIAIQLLIHLSSEIIAGRRSDSRSREEQINCPTKQLRLTWHVVCLPSAEFPEQTFQFPFPSAGRVMKGRGRLEVVVGFIHSSFLSSHTLKSTASLEERKRRKKEKEKKKKPPRSQQPHSSTGMFGFTEKVWVLPWKATRFPLW